MGDGTNLQSQAAHERPGARLVFGWKRSLPVILQSERSECGLACLAMIARYYGHRVDLNSLRRKYKTSMNGISLGRLIDIANEMQFLTRPVRAEITQLSSLRVPCVLHWDLNHFVVLKSVNRKGLVLHDPVTGESRISLAVAARHFTGVALELWPASGFTPRDEAQRISVRSAFGRINGLAQALLQVFILAAALEIFTLAGPFYLQWILDNVLVSNDRSLLTLLGIGFIAITFFRSLISGIRSWTVTRLNSTMEVEWASSLFRHLLTLPLEWFDKRHIGDVVSRFESSNSIQRTVSTDFIGTVLDGIMSISTVAIMLAYSMKMTLIAAFLLAMYSLLRWLFFAHLRRANEERLVSFSRQQSEFLESVRGISSIKISNKNIERAYRYVNASVETANASIKIERLNIAYTLILQIIFGVGRVCLIWIAASLALSNQLTAGAMVAFVAYCDQFTTRAGALVDKIAEFAMLKLHVERVSEIALSKPESVGGSRTDIKELKATIELSNVSFRYDDSSPWIIRRCNLIVSEGESVAITGPSGCGKSTLAKIILGLLAPVEGVVRYGGVDLKDLNLHSYRELISAVMQNDHLFAGSLFENISFFDPSAIIDRVEDAARQASIDKDISAMPMGYHTLVGDMGSSLSGGQKQRVILARALYRNPRVLVLDEATSHLDADRERLINEEIRSMSITRILFAHREETIASADRVVELPEINGLG